MLSFSKKENQLSTEKLLGFSFNYEKSEITIHVVTNGCTVKTDFVFKTNNNTILVSRKKKDVCKALPQAAHFTYTMKELGIDPNKLYIIKNKFIANPNLANIP
jgi:hypothetical protein